MICSNVSTTYYLRMILSSIAQVKRQITFFRFSCAECSTQRPRTSRDFILFACPLQREYGELLRFLPNSLPLWMTALTPNKSMVNEMEGAC
jgi:hypothetical protein